MTSVYRTTQGEIDGVRMLSHLSGKKPDGFDRTQHAVDEYLDDMRSRYEAAAEMVNDPSPKHNFDFEAAHGSDYGVHYAGAILKAFDADLRDAGFSVSMQQRLRSRIRGG